MKICIKCGAAFDQPDWACPVCGCEPGKIDGHLAFSRKDADTSEGFEPHYFSRLVRIEAGSFWFRSRNRLLCWALKRYFPEARSFLEIGCGTGFVLSAMRKAFPSLQLQGSEIFSNGLRFAADRLPGIELFQMDARRIPFEEEFDVIGAFDVLEHIREDKVVLGQLYRAVRKGGGILLTVPQHPFLWSETDSHARHVRRYVRAELNLKIEEAGFKVERNASFVSLLFPLMLMSRWWQGRREKFDPLAEFSLSPRMDLFLEKIMSLELFLVRAGVSLPFGGSLLVAARKIS